MINFNDAHVKHTDLQQKNIIQVSVYWYDQYDMKHSYTILRDPEPAGYPITQNSDVVDLFHWMHVHDHQSYDM